MTNSESQSLKAQCLADIREALGGFSQILCHIDDRLWSYALSIVSTDEDLHNIDEIFGFRKFLRMLATYEFDYEAVQLRIRMFESLKLDSIHGYRYYKATPSQIFIFACIFGFRDWFDTESPEGSRELMDTEKVIDGHICDKRNPITSFVAEIPRKYGKTCIAGFLHFEGLLLGDRDYEGYCVANSQDQSSLVFEALRDMLSQVDGGKRFRFTATEISWKKGQQKTGTVNALTAGGKAKDGLKASRSTNDEFGAAQRVKDHCDMEGLVNVVEGSMGPRREHLSIHTSTAGLGVETPYELLVRNVQEDLYQEINYPLDGQPHRRDSDWQLCLLLHPDLWEMDDESLQTERVIRKCNPHLGITIQPDYYRKEWAQVKIKGESKLLEIRTKLYNIFQSDRVNTWLTAEDIRPLQQDRTIDDLSSDDGWVCFIGMDFSKGDDLNAQSYLCYNTVTGEFFADMDAWISEESLHTNTNHTLYELWHSQGHLHTSPGATINENLVLDRIVEISNHLTILRFGYDAYDASRFINAISAWIYSEGQDPKTYLRPVSQQFATYNSLVQEIDYLVKNDPPLIHFSNNPMWPWEWSNCILQESNDGMGNLKMIKASANQKIDNCQCLASALKCYEEMQTQIQ